jgi:hypothetical protein
MNRLALLLCAALCGCGGKSGTLSLSIVTSPSDDPFQSAATVRITIGDNVTVKTAPVNMGHFTLKFDQKPGDTPMTVLV